MEAVSGNPLTNPLTNYLERATAAGNETLAYSSGVHCQQNGSIGRASMGRSQLGLLGTHPWYTSLAQMTPKLLKYHEPSAGAAPTLIISLAPPLGEYIGGATERIRCLSGKRMTGLISPFAYVRYQAPRRDHRDSNSNYTGTSKAITPNVPRKQYR